MCARVRGSVRERAITTGFTNSFTTSFTTTSFATVERLLKDLCVCRCWYVCARVRWRASVCVSVCE